MIKKETPLFTLIQESDTSNARLGRIETDHGYIETPIFMPVGTAGTVKAVTNSELINDVKAEIILGNSYHLYLRPGTDIISAAGGLHRFMSWDHPILTDSGGFQVFSLSGIRDLHEEGVTFQSHIDGSSHTFTPENVVTMQRRFGSDIMMVLDECPPNPSSHEYASKSVRLTHQWAKIGRQAFLDSEPLYGHRQYQFGIVQGCTYPDLRKESSSYISELDFEGNAIGGLSVGEPAKEMYAMTEICTAILPKQKPRYLMGVGTPANLLESVARGIDMFDCVMPTRNARNGMLFTRHGTINTRNAKWKDCFEPADPGFPSPLCRNYSMAYIHHLIKNKEIVGLSLASVHNLAFYLWLMKEIKNHIKDGTFGEWYPKMARETGRKL